MIYREVRESDPAAHNGSVPGVVVAVISWSATRKEAISPVTPKQVLELLPGFQLRRRELDIAWGGYPPWSEVIAAAIEVARLLASDPVAKRLRGVGETRSLTRAEA
jgi:hypothetical protein